MLLDMIFDQLFLPITSKIKINTDPAKNRNNPFVENWEGKTAALEPKIRPVKIVIISCLYFCSKKENNQAKINRPKTIPSEKTLKNNISKLFTAFKSG